MAVLGTGLTPTEHYAQLNRMRLRVYDITDFGAVGDNNTVNTTAIQNAINAAHAVGGGIVLVPYGIFKTGALTTYSYVRIVGAGIHNSELRSNAAETMFTCANAAYISWMGFQDICLNGNNVGTIAYTSNYECDFQVNRVYIRNFTTKGFNMSYALIGEFNRAIFQNCGIAAYLLGSNSDLNSNLLTFNGCEFYSNTGWAIQLVNGLLLKVNNCDLSSNGTNGNYNTGAISFQGGKGVLGANMGLIIRDSWGEANYGTLVDIKEPYATHKNLSIITGCQFNYNTPNMKITVTGAITENKLILDKTAFDAQVDFYIDGAHASLVNDQSVVEGIINKTNSAKSYTVAATEDQ